MSLSIGIDLCDDYTAVCINEDRSLILPTVICRDKIKEKWYIGEEAYSITLKGQGVMTDKLVKLLQKNGTSTISKRIYKAEELIREYFNALMEMIIGRRPIEDIDKLVLCIRKPDISLMDKLMDILKSIGIRQENISIISHEEAFCYYTLSQDKKLYDNMVCMFDLSDEELTYYEFKVVRGTGRNIAVAEGTDLEEAFHIDILKNESGRKLGDRIILSCAKKMMEEKIFSAVFLTGKGFENLDWAKDFKEYICKRRRVLQEQGIFARGAAILAMDKLRPKSEFPYEIFCDTRFKTELSLRLLVNNRNSKLILTAAGESWYGYSAYVEFIPNEQNYVDIDIMPVDKYKDKRVARISLEEFPKRPNRCTRVGMSLKLITPGRLEIVLKDKGFGDIYPVSGIEIREEIDI
ncbi:MAG: DUF5716 family protein [Eubacteriales bacterium]|nr:DUF5716 family protein [Eubacteriales bacterium]